MALSYCSDREIATLSAVENLSFKGVIMPNLELSALAKDVFAKNT